jgi:hypothetical protein
VFLAFSAMATCGPPDKTGAASTVLLLYSFFFCSAISSSDSIVGLALFGILDTHAAVIQLAGSVVLLIIPNRR